MAKSLLRSGSLADFFALGENGQPVYTSALQLRETLRLRRLQDIADCLAIPQPNEAGDRIDWYAPIEGKMTSWMSASDETRDAALEQLTSCLERVASLSEKALASDKPAQQRFGALLSKAFQFPAANYVYLIDGQPVITFWGFINLDQKPRSDALDCLREVLPSISTQSLVDPLIPEVAVAAVAAVAASAPLSAAAAVYTQTAELPIEPEDSGKTPAATGESAIPPAFSASRQSALRRWWWVVPGVALAGALVWQFRGGVPATPAKPARQTAHVPEKRVLPATEKPQEAEAVAQPAAPIAPPPLAVATPSAPQDNTPAAKVPQAHPVVAPAPHQPAGEEKTETALAESKPIEKNALVMPALAVKLGKIDFLNGSWRVTQDIKTPTIGKPASLRYQIKNGEGTVRLTHGDGIVCRTNVHAGLMQSGNLIINSRVKARCSDGSRYQMPEIVCTQAASGPAECTGRYDGDNVLPLTIKRESE